MHTNPYRPVDPADLQVQLAAQAFAKRSATAAPTLGVQRVSVSGAVTIDLSQGSNWHLTFTGNVTGWVFNNPVDGVNYNFRFIQDGVGGHTVAALPAAFKFGGGVAPVFSSAANAWDSMEAEWGQTEGSYASLFTKGMA